MVHNTQFDVRRESPNLWRVTFDNPPLNLLTPDAIRELHGLISEIESDNELKVVLFDSANPDYFIAHYDMSKAAETPSAERPGDLHPWGDFTLRLARAPVVSIAAVKGRARGVGNEFALACDLRFASLERAIFCQPEVGVGIVPGGGAIERLPLLVGRARALEVLLVCDDFDAATAEKYGLINRAVPDAEFEGFVGRVAQRLSTFDKQALSAVKELVNRLGVPEPASLVASSAAFRKSLAWEGARRRIAPLIRAGLSQPGDFELRLGEHIGNIMVGGSFTA
jgi:enoyl-CoA hydratase/carnithine racemase